MIKFADQVMKLIFRKYIPCVFLFLIPFCGCNLNHGFEFHYELNKPDCTYKLPGKLKEISGITFYRKNKLACVQDEKGKIYIYDTKKEDLKQVVDFGGDHDYEGITN